MRKLLTIAIAIMIAMPQQAHALRPMAKGISRLGLIRKIAWENFIRLPEVKSFSIFCDEDRIMPYPDSKNIRNILLVTNRWGLGDTVYLEKIGNALSKRYPLASEVHGGGIDIMTNSGKYWRVKRQYRNIVLIPEVKTKQAIADMKKDFTHCNYDLIVIVTGSITALNVVSKLLDNLDIDLDKTALFAYTLFYPYLQEYFYDTDRKSIIPNTTGVKWNDDYNVCFQNIPFLINAAARRIDPNQLLYEKAELQVTVEDKAAMRNMIREMVRSQLGPDYTFDDKTQLVFYNNFTAESVSKKIDWKVFADGVIEKAEELRKANVIVCLESGTPKDYEEAEEIADYIKTKAPNAPFIRLMKENGEGLSQEEYIKIISVFDAVIGIDTSSQHIAAASGVPSLTIFSVNLHMIWPPSQYHGMGGVSFFAENYSDMERSKDVDSNFVIQSIMAILSLKRGNYDIFIPEHRAEALRVINNIIEKSMELAEELSLMPDEIFNNHFISLLDEAETLLEYLKPEFRMLASGCNYENNLYGNQIENIKSLASPMKKENKRMFIQYWLESNLFYLIELVCSSSIFIENNAGEISGNIVLDTAEGKVSLPIRTTIEQAA